MTVDSYYGVDLQKIIEQSGRVSWFEERLEDIRKLCRETMIMVMVMMYRTDREREEREREKK